MLTKNEITIINMLIDDFPCTEMGYSCTYCKYSNHENGGCLLDNIRIKLLEMEK